ncbi:MAG: c-type cytochrome [Planctomycetes bacterium]|nr:c-type cytochrome [Planctomycetota bacterium]
MSEYIDKLREHEFDGIHEFDNYLPRWWLWTFYLACIFSVVYWLYYHGTALGPSSTAHFDNEYEAHLALEAKTKPVTGAMLEEYAKLPKMLEAGKQIFETNCATCHKPDGSGLVGPNLTDKHWIHGPGAETIYKVVSEGGRPGQGMVAWKTLLSAQKRQQVVAYVLGAIKHTNRPGKAPEGTPEK